VNQPAFRVLSNRRAFSISEVPEAAPARLTADSRYVLVTYYGHATPFWMPAPDGGAIGRDAVLVFEAQLADEVLVSDAQWRSQRSGAWSLPAALPGLQGVPVEVFDARQLPSAWKELGFDDSSWQSATTLAAGHIGSMGRSQPPT
jgi:alpha-L-rhamnosidase